MHLDTYIIIINHNLQYYNEVHTCHIIIIVYYIYVYTIYLSRIIPSHIA